MSREVDRLTNRWQRGDWPQWLDWLEIEGIRGWLGQRISFGFPIVALVGENGVGKSTVLQAVASVYKAPKGEKSFFASDFFPSTPWEHVTGVSIRYSARQGNHTAIGSVRKPTERWRGNPDRPERHVRYIDLRRTQPIIARRGYRRMTKGNVEERRRQPFDPQTVKRYGNILGRQYTDARFALSSVDEKRWVPVASFGGTEYSGFHQGAGETTVADLLRLEIPNTAVLLIDEIETSLHPRAQRRLIRDLADQARLQQLQVIITTHSPYVLEELPPEARIQIIASMTGRQVLIGVSPEFAMTQMDEQPHPEVDIYVEDNETRLLLLEILAKYRPDYAHRVQIVPYGSGQVGKSLGQMAHQNRFPRPSVVVLDGDQDPAEGCVRLPGDDAPERVVFDDLQRVNWPNVADRLNRSHAKMADSAERAMSGQHHHEWLREVGDAVLLGSSEVWRALVVSWLEHCVEGGAFDEVLDAIDEAFGD